MIPLNTVANKSPVIASRLQGLKTRLREQEKELESFVRDIASLGNGEGPLSEEEKESLAGAVYVT